MSSSTENPCLTNIDYRSHSEAFATSETAHAFAEKCVAKLQHEGLGLRTRLVFLDITGSLVLDLLTLDIIYGAFKISAERLWYLLRVAKHDYDEHIHVGAVDCDVFLDDTRLPWLEASSFTIAGMNLVFIDQACSPLERQTPIGEYEERRCMALCLLI